MYEPLPALPPLARPRVWTVFAAFGVATVLNLVTGLFAIAVTTVGWVYTNAGVAPTAEELAGVMGMLAGRPLVVTAWICASCVSLFTLLAALAWRSPRPAGARFALGTGEWPRQRTVLVGAVATMAIAQLTAGVVAAAGLRASSLDSLTLAAQRSTPTEFLALLVPMVVLAPLGEELFFRGYVQTRLTERWGAGAGMWATAVLFGLFHVNPVHAVTTTALGAMLGYLRHRTGDVRASVVAHGLNNLAAMLLVRAAPAEADGSELAVGWEPAVGWAVALVAATGAIAWLRAAPPTALARDAPVPPGGGTRELPPENAA